MNVSEVMKESAALHGDNGDTVAKAAMIKARDAVAELIEATREARDLLSGWDNLSANNVSNLAAEVCELLNAALAKASP